MRKQLPYFCPRNTRKARKWALATLEGRVTPRPRHGCNRALQLSVLTKVLLSFIPVHIAQRPAPLPFGEGGRIDRLDGDPPSLPRELSSNIPVFQHSIIPLKKLPVRLFQFR